MSKKKEEPKKLFVPVNEVDKLQEEYITTIETDPQFSLEVDPTNKYKMTNKQKEFIKNYVQFKNIPLTCQLCGIDEEEGKSYFLAYTSQQEIRRINLAMYHRQFSNKLLDLDQVGGYLSSLIQDEVPIADRLSSKDKLTVIKMIIELNELKQTAFSDPRVINTVEVTEQIKDLSVKSIKQLLSASESKKLETADVKDKAIEELNEKSALSPEEIAYLKSLPADQLLKLLDKGE